MTTPNLIAASVALAVFASTQSLPVYSLPPVPKAFSTSASDNNTPHNINRYAKRRLLHEERENTTTTEASQIDHRNNFELFVTIAGLLGGITLVTGLGVFWYGLFEWQKGRADEARGKEFERRKGEDELLRNIFGNRKTTFLSASPSCLTTVVPMPPPLPETLTKQFSEVIKLDHFTDVFSNPAKKEGPEPSSLTKQRNEAGWGSVWEISAHDNGFASRSDSNGNTPLHYCQTVEDVNIFIEWGADPDATNSDGNTPLHLCQNVEVLQALLSHGANPDLANNDGNTPLHFCQEPAIAHALLSHGANPNLANNEGNTAIMMDTVNSRTSVLIIILDWLEVISFDETSALFHIAARADNAQLFRYLIKRNMHRDMHFERRSFTTVSTDQQSLLNPDGATLLHEAISAGNLETALYILETGLIDANATDEHGNTPLHAAANSSILGEYLNSEDGNAERLIYLLIQNNADINAQNAADSTPIHRAVLKYNTPFLRFILVGHESSNVNPDVEVNLSIEANGFTAIELACQRDNEEMVSLLLPGSILTDAGRRSRLLLQMTQGAHLRVLRSLTRNSARNLFDINSVYEEGNTVLHIAAQSKKLHLVEVLLNLGAKPNIKNEAGKTALDLLQDRPRQNLTPEEKAIMSLLAEKMRSEKEGAKNQDLFASHERRPLNRTLGDSPNLPSNSGR